MRGRDAISRKWRHLLLHNCAFIATTTETFSEGAADRGAILSDPDRLTEIRARVLNSHVTKEMMIVKNEQRRYQMVAWEDDWMIGCNLAISTSVNPAADAEKRKIFIFIIKIRRERRNL